MRRLYEIDADIERCLAEGTDPETGEMVAWEALEALGMERAAKIEGVALFAKDIRAEAAAVKAEMDALGKRYERLTKQADGAENWVSISLGGERFSTPKVDCVFRKSEKVEFDFADDDADTAFVNWANATGATEFITHKETITDKPNRAAIKAHLKAGGKLEHCRLQEYKNLTIK